MPSEIGNREVGRKSIVASRIIRAGELFTQNNLTTKRPGTGISPMEWDGVLGRRAKRTYFPDDLLQQVEVDSPNHCFDSRQEG
jgi:sialic acid synthase SpsE